MTDREFLEVGQEGAGNAAPLGGGGEAQGCAAVGEGLQAQARGRLVDRAEEQVGVAREQLETEPVVYIQSEIRAPAAEFL